MIESSSPKGLEEQTPPPNRPHEEAAVRKRARPVRYLLVVLALGVVLFFGLRYLADSFAHETTDDAFIEGHIVPIASKVPGEVLVTHVNENQEVKAGELLVEIDQRDAEVRASQKRAALQSAQANQRAFEAGFELMRARVKTAEATQKQSEAEAQASKATFENANANWLRASNLWSGGSQKVISEQDFDTAKATMHTAKANWEANLEKAASDASKVIEARAQLTTAEKLYEQAGAQVVSAQADVKAVELELSYTKIPAPVDGRVTRKMVEKGAYIQVGQNLLAIVRPEIWVTAHFKETQTTRIRPGQPVQIKIEGVADRTWRGHVDSIQSGSGARFSLLPPENAVGNYVKVVQRVPVKILFDEAVQAGQGLGPGMSVVPSVQIGNQPFSDLVMAIAAIATACLVVGIFWFLKQRRSKARA